MVIQIDLRNVESLGRFIERKRKEREAAGIQTRVDVFEYELAGVRRFNEFFRACQCENYQFYMAKNSVPGLKPADYVV